MSEELKKCPSCGSRLRAEQQPIQFENDDTPDKQTIAFLPIFQICDNANLNGTDKKCSRYGEVANIIMHKLE